MNTKLFGLLTGLAVAVSAQTATVDPSSWRTEGAVPYPGINVNKRAEVQARQPAPAPTPVLEVRGSGCDANNCARAVTGTRTGKMPSVPSRQADCSSFLEVTVLTNYGGFPVSTITPTAVPTYATACSTPVNAQSAYASACSCWGIPPSTTTSAVPQACVVDHVAHPCADGYGGECYCWEDKGGNLYCDGSFFGSWILPAGGSCSQDSDCPSSRPICAIDGVCDYAVAASECA